MMDLLKVSKELFSMISIQNIIDILIVTYLAYKIIYWISGTQAAEVAKGVLLILLITQLSDWMGLITLSYILKNVLTVGLIVLVVVFQPELRRVLSKIGRTKISENKIFKRIISFTTKDTAPTKIIEEVVEACVEMSKLKRGALIVIERQSNLDDIISTGVKMEADISSELLMNVFVPYTPLHDGAAVIRIENARIMAASCLLPLTQAKNLRKELGTRHRAAIGMSEVSDALIVIVSEETGIISIAERGSLSRFLNANTLKERLNEGLTEKESTINTDGFWRSADGKKQKEE